MSFQQELYTDLMHLVHTNEAFYTVDHEINGVKYSVFTYRLASYSDFLLPNALECRGHMFRVEPRQQVTLVSLPFEKFFNLNENPLTMDLDLSDVEFIHEKRDGSLISTYLHEDEVRLKSKTALASDQALDAMRQYHSDYDLRLKVDGLVKSDHTVSFEYTSPENRIVLPYQSDALHVLGVRDNRTGKYMPPDDLYSYFGTHMVEDHTFMVDDSQQFIQQIPNMKGIEGFVIGLGSGQRIKVKTDEYFSLHRAKDSIQSDRRLFEVAVRGATDDLRSLFHDDQYTLDRIDRMEKIAGHALNSMVHSVENFHKDNKHLDRKSYAIKGQQELSRMEFNCAMQLFTGREVDYESVLIKNHEKFIAS